MNRIFGTPSGVGTQIAVIGIVTVLFTLSAMSGVHRGVKYISEVTTALGIGLAAYVLIVGPTNFVSNLFVRSLGQYVNELRHHEPHHAAHRGRHGVDAVVDLLHDGLVAELGRLRRRLPGEDLQGPHHP